MDEQSYQILEFSGATLRRAAFLGRLKVVNRLIDEGADIHANNDEALRWAASNGHYEVVKVLIEEGANIHAQGDCAINCAFNNHYPKIVKLLKLHDIKQFVKRHLIKLQLNEKL